MPAHCRHRRGTHLVHKVLERLWGRQVEGKLLLAIAQHGAGRVKAQEAVHLRRQAAGGSLGQQGAPPHGPLLCGHAGSPLRLLGCRRAAPRP